MKTKTVDSNCFIITMRLARYPEKIDGETTMYCPRFLTIFATQVALLPSTRMNSLPGQCCLGSSSTIGFSCKTGFANLA